jgi:DNA-binding transcriptional LysR family regulator
MKEALLARLHSRLRIRHMLLLKTLGAVPNLRRAAASLNLSQPVASTLLKELEEAFGEKLFERTARGLEPTPAGTAMASWAVLVLADLECARADLKSIEQGKTRRLRIGVSPVAAPMLLPRALGPFFQTFPKATLSIQTGVESSLTALVLQGELDCAVCRLAPEADNSALTYSMLYSEPSDVVVGAHHPLAKAKTFTPARMNDYDWILPVSQGAPYNLTAKRLVEEGCAMPHVAIETWSTVVLVNLLQFGNWLAVLPRSIARAQVRSGALAVLPFSLPDTLMPLAVITRRGPAGSGKVLLALVESLQKVARELARAGTTEVRRGT